ncbi:MAG: aldolase catalytic domain-containing protein [Oscillospiraceae bacterium]|jgi:4-hydroxy 2-oxovalerate aldolase|nr:aldolase catalytic domain-containing protein [Oscillospiraceae bacterium]
MKNVQILDCTLRDGGRIIDCAFPDRDIFHIADKLSGAGIDVVELGFLRDGRTVNYRGNSTFFTDVDQITPFIPKGIRGTEYVAFIDYGMFDFTTLKTRSQDSICGLRVGFTKKNYEEHYDDLLSAFYSVKARGYDLFIQGVNSLDYSDIELLKIVETVNMVKPVSFGIVDTYGAMYVDDVSRLYGLIDYNLDKAVAIDFHSHNNFQLSFSFAQEVIRLSRGVRNIIIDATLDGMGKGAGNLNTELIADFLVRKMNYGYDTDIIFDAIDEHLHDLREKYHWGYSPASMLSGIFRSHPNNVIYLTQKFRLNTKDIKNILSMLGEQERQRYDYNKIDKLTEEYSESTYDDSDETAYLAEQFADKPILILSPGKTLLTYKERIGKYIEAHNPTVISVNFTYDEPDSYSFFANKKRYVAQAQVNSAKMIVASNIEQREKGAITVNYHSIVNRGYKLFDNSVLMLLNLLKRLRVAEIAIAGMDGFMNSTDGNYFDKSLNVERLGPQLDEINRELYEMLENYAATVSGLCKVSLITPSIFEKLFEVSP